MPVIVNNRLGIELLPTDDESGRPVGAVPDDFANDVVARNARRNPGLSRIRPLVPRKTLAASGISGFSNILTVYRERAPLRRTVEATEVGEAAAFLLGDAGKAVTGEVLMVDSGFHVTGM
jgi:enoyl-[acyl-carrier-protein] reductase (NADH)